MKPVKTPFWILGGCLIVAAWPHLFMKGQIPVDGNVLRLFYPDWVFLHRHPPSFREWPLWNPYRNMGEPFFADPQSMAAYPPMWILCRFSSYLDFTRLWIFGHTFLAAGFMWAWVMRLTRDRAAAASSALLAAFNGYLTSQASLPNHFAAAAWVPAIFYFFDAGEFIGLGMALAFQWLAGFPPFCVVTAAALAAWSIFAAAPQRMALIKAAILAAGLAAFQWIPFLELFIHSSRPLLLDSAAAVDYSEPLPQLARMLLVPQWFAWQPQLMGDPAVVSFYAGPFAALAAAWAVWKGRRNERWTAAGILLCLFLSLGLYCPGYAHCLPLHLFRFPANWLLPAVSALAALSGIGISRFTRRRWKWMTAGLILVDLLAFAQYVRVPWFNVSFLEEAPSLAVSFRPDARTSRLYHSPPVMAALDHEKLRSMDDYRYVKNALIPSYGMAFGVREISSYQVLTLKRAAAYQARLAMEGPASPLLRWAGGSLVIVPSMGHGAWAPRDVQAVFLHDFVGPVFWESETAVAPLPMTLDRARAVRIQTDSARGGRLVFSDVAYPGWNAFIDDKKAPLSLFQETFLAVQVPAGRHEVDFRFFSSSFTAGALISLLTALGLLLFRRRLTG